MNALKFLAVSLFSVALVPLITSAPAAAQCGCAAGGCGCGPSCGMSSGCSPCGCPPSGYGMACGPRPCCRPYGFGFFGGSRCCSPCSSCCTPSCGPTTYGMACAPCSGPIYGMSMGGGYPPTYGSMGGCGCSGPISPGVGGGSMMPYERDPRGLQPAPNGKTGPPQMGDPADAAPGGSPPPTRKPMPLPQDDRGARFERRPQTSVGAAASDDVTSSDGSANSVARVERRALRQWVSAGFRTRVLAPPAARLIAAGTPIQQLPIQQLGSPVPGQLEEEIARRD